MNNNYNMGGQSYPNGNLNMNQGMPPYTNQMPNMNQGMPPYPNQMYNQGYVQKKKSPVLFIVLGVVAFLLIGIVVVGVVAYNIIKNEYEREMAASDYYDFYVRSYDDDGSDPVQSNPYDDLDDTIGGSVVKGVIDNYNSTDEDEGLEWNVGNSPWNQLPESDEEESQ